MSDEIKDGGPAFPHNNPNYDGNWDKEPQRAGMSLRDWFAGQVIPAIISVTSAGTHEPGLSNPDMAGKPIGERMVYDAYSIADAMLAERSK